MMAATFVDDDSLDDQDNDQEQAQFTEEPTQEEEVFQISTQASQYKILYGCTKRLKSS
jgi:hypothetical protein